MLGLARLPAQLSRFPQALIERALHTHRVCAIHVGDGNFGFGLQVHAPVGFEYLWTVWLVTGQQDQGVAAGWLGFGRCRTRGQEQRAGLVNVDALVDDPML